MKKLILTLTGCICIPAFLSAQTNTTLQQQLPVLMQRDHIPGLTAAYIRQGKVAWVQTFGEANVSTHAPATDSTLFEAASLTKVVTAYAALKMIAAGKLDPDKPLCEYLGNNYDMGNDARIKLVTARRVLSHSAGFPNWRNPADSLLPIRFTPGARFSYSGEGFVYLSKVMEKISGTPFPQLIAQLVFEPLGMKHSYLTFVPEKKELFTIRHDWIGHTSWFPDYTNVNAAASLRTTARDYATFLATVLNKPLGIYQTQIKVDTAKMPQLAWGLGVGLDSTTKTKYIWHWGDQGDSKAFFCGDVKSKEGVVYFTNSANGLSIVPDVLDIVFGKQALDIEQFVAYGKFDPAKLDLVKAIEQQGAEKALAEYKGTMDEDQLNSFGYYFLNNKNYDAAVVIFKKNVKEHPTSANTWDSLGEAYLLLSKQNYEKSLALDPENAGAASVLKKLK